MGLPGKGGTRGYLNQIRMGEVTGIGTIGRSGLLLNARYGPRLMLGGVVTTAALPVTGRTESREPGCPPGCRACMDVCPVKAISAEKKRVDVMRCLRFTARTPLLPKIKFLLLQALRPRAAERLMNITTIDENTMHVCSRCVEACPSGNGGARSGV